MSARPFCQECFDQVVSGILGETTRRTLIMFAVFLGLGRVPPINSQSSGQTLKKVVEFNLPGPEGKRFDYLSIDTDDHYLFSAHLAAGQTYVIDLGTNKVVVTVADTPGVEGIEYVAELKKFYTSSAGDNTIRTLPIKEGCTR
jgi:hypothetical protein